MRLLGLGIVFLPCCCSSAFRSAISLLYEGAL